MRPLDGAKPIDLAPVRHAVHARELWAGVGIVAKRDGDSSHFQVVDGDVNIEIDLMPSGEQVTARLGGFGSSGKGTGCWKIPAVGTEVAWICPSGNLDSDVCVVASLSSGGVPDGLDGDEYVLINPKKVHVESTDDVVEVFSKGNLTVKSSNGDVVLTANGVAKVNGDSYALPQWDSFATVLSTCATTIGNLTPNPPTTLAQVLAMVGTIISQFNTLSTSMSSNSNYKSTKAKNG